MQIDYVVYYKDDKEIVSILLDVKEMPKFLINEDFVALYILHDDYTLTTKDGKAYFENLNEKLLYLDDFRGRYEE